MATTPGSTLLAFPGRQSGYVQLVRLPPLGDYPLQQAKRPPSTAFPSTSILIAHTSSLAALCSTPSGTLVATASEKGTLVRVWDVATSQLVRELRRGTDTAEIFGLSLRPDGGALAVSSDKGTVHVWRLAREREKPKPAEECARPCRSRCTLTPSRTARKPISFSTFKPYLPKYFSSEWSHSQFRLPPPAVPLTRFSSVPDETPSIEDDVCQPFWLPPLDSDTSNVDGEPDLMLLTQSGGLFRVSTGHRPAEGKGKGKEREREPTPPPPLWGASPDGDLQLVEYRRWGGEEGWDW
jgi:WD40 repeat protein